MVERTSSSMGWGMGPAMALPIIMEATAAVMNLSCILMGYVFQMLLGGGV